jgi:hypothetical protein
MQHNNDNNNNLLHNGRAREFQECATSLSLCVCVCVWCVCVCVLFTLLYNKKLS